MSEDNKYSKLEQRLIKEGINEQEAITIIKSSRAKPSNEKKLYISNKSFSYAYFSDPHIGHEQFKPQLFDKMLRLIKRNKPDFVLNAGDTLEGMSGREGHIYELTHVGFQQQINYANNLLSQINIPLYLIDGNHDGWFFNKNNGGLVVGEELAIRNNNINFLGQMEGDLNVSGVKIKLFHGNDGTAYANCFDDKTEILTENGWKLFKDLTKKEKIATLNLEKDEFEWQLPEEYIDEEYNGEMLHFNSRTVDLLVTPNHRMLVRKYPNNLLQSRKKTLEHPEKSHIKIDFDWKAIEAKQLENCKRQEWQLKRISSNWKGELLEEIEIPFRESKNKGVRVHHFEKQNIEDIAELIAWYVTEGYIRRSELSIAQFKKINPENYFSIVDLFRRIGIEPKQKREKYINVGSLELCEWLLSECGHKSKNKFLPKWLKNQPQDILQIVFDTMIAGDGWINDQGFGYRSISRQLLSDFEEIAIKLGYAVSENNDSVSISKTQILPTINKKPNKVKYNGRIYCVSVPNTYIMVRRNGKSIWSGNSYKLQKLVESFTGGEKPDIIHSGHYHKALYQHSRNIHGFESGTLCGQSKFMRGKKIPAHMGFGFVTVYHNKKGVERLIHEWVPGY